MAENPLKSRMYALESNESDEIKESENIVKQLVARLQKDKVFTKVGNRCMISLKASKKLPIFSTETSKLYANNFNQQTLPPHVFNISQSAYLHALWLKVDQSIILLYFYLI